MTKPTLCLDFDGVIHSYVSGWRGIDVIPDPPVPGALEFIRLAQEHFAVAIYSSRSSERRGRVAMASWLSLQMTRLWGPNDAKAILAVLQWPEHKPSAFVTLDDRAVTFEGVWPHPVDLLKFRPWQKR